MKTESTEKVDELKTKVDANTAAINVEKERAIAKEDAIQANLNTAIANHKDEVNALTKDISDEANARIAGDAALQVNIDKEVTDRKNADTLINNAIAQEVSDRTTAIQGLESKKVDKVDGKVLSSNDFTDILLLKLNGIAEHANYITKVSELLNDSGFQTAEEVEAAIQKIIGSAPGVLDTLEEIAKALGDDPNFATTMTQKLTELTAKIETETQNRISGDEALETKLTTLSTTLTKTVEDLRTYVTETRTELLARVNNQDALINQNSANIQRNLELIQGIQNNISGSYLEVKALLETEIAARKAEIVRVEGLINDTNQALTTETEERKAADKELQDNLDAEEAARTAADTALGVRIDTETSERKAADTALQTKLDKEIQDRTDADTALQTKLDKEISDRTTADTALGTRIDNEEDAREAADTTLQENLDTEETERKVADKTLQDNIDATNAHTINTHRLDSNPVLNGTDIKLDGYTKATGTTPADLDIKSTDTTSQAFGKVQKRIEVDKADADDKITKVKTAVGLTDALALPSLEDTHYLSESSNIVEGMKELDKQIADGRHDEVWEVLYTQFTQISGFSVSPTIIEKGVDADITIRGNNLFNSKPLVPETLSVKRGITVINSTPIASLNIKDTLNTEDDRTTYTLSITSKGVTKTATANVNAYYPMYFGHSAKAALTGEDVLGLTKQAIKSSPNGTYNMTGIAEGEYVWLCVPSNFSITKVTSSGFGVPMAAAATVTVEGKGSYKCYRTEGALKAGNFNFVIG